MIGAFSGEKKRVESDAEWLLLTLDWHEKSEEEKGKKFGAQAPREGRVLVVGAGTVGTTGAKIMPRGLPTRRGLQALALILATAYATILLYQAVAPRQVTHLLCINTRRN